MMIWNAARHIWLFRVVASLCLLLATAQAATAQGTPAAEVDALADAIVFGVYPAGTTEGIYFESFVEPGASHEFSLAIYNGGTADLGLLAYHADVYSMTNGGMGVNFQDQERTAPTTWLSFDEGVVNVPAGQEIIKAVTVTVPEGTSPGQYVTAIAVETADSYAVGEEGGAFRQVLRKVVAVVILVPGDAKPSFTLGAPEVLIHEGQTVLRVPVENTGNIRVRPAGTVTLTNADGSEVATGEVAMGSVYMGHTAPYELVMPVAIPVGEYTVNADLADPDTGVSASIEDAAVTVVPEATPDPVAAATPIPATPVPDPDPVGVTSVEIAANADPIQFAAVAFDIENSGNYIGRARISLVVSHDGEVVEEFVIDDNLPLPVGTTRVDDRYIPPSGWESGVWTFSIKAISINTNESVETVIVSAEDVATIEVP